MGVTPDSIVELWVRTLVKHGIGSMWVFDCLHNVEKQLEVCRIARDAGATAHPQLNFSESPVHTDEHYAGLIGRMARADACDTIILGDEAGVLHPERARRWIRLMRDNAAGIPLELHFHDRTAMGALNHAIGVEEGCHILHTACRSLANGHSLPSVEVSTDNMRRLGHDVTLDTTYLEEISQHFAACTVQEGFTIGAPVEYSVAAIQQQFPGGMMGTLGNQLAQYGMADRLPEVLEEAVQVRAEMGWPLMATPFSQLVGIQALLNVVQGERYATIPDENLMYIAGWYGDPPGTVDEELKDRALAMQRGREIMDSEPAQPSLKEIRAAYGERLSDEELILRYLMPDTDVDAMQQAQTPIEPVHPIGDLGWISDVIKTGAGRTVKATRGGVSVQLRR
jgi:oxaloacetate decarboxylase alpha subunit